MTDTKRMRLRYAGDCVRCGARIEKGEWGIYDKGARTVHCPEHDESSTPAAESTVPPNEPAAPTPSVPSASATADRAAGSDDGTLPRLIKVKYAGTCTACDVALARGVEAFWVKNSRVMVCPACTGKEVTLGLRSEPSTAGASAARIADGAARAHAERLLAAYPMLGEHLLENAKPTSTMHRWDRGADGERVMGRALDRKVAAGDIVVLHDRRMPSRGGNIDHLVVGPRRIAVIDAKHYRGRKVRTPYRLFGERRLEVDGKPADELLDGVLAQRRVVETAVGQELAGCVDAILAFIGADLGLFGGQWGTRSVSCMDPKEAVGRASTNFIIGEWPYRFDAERRAEIGEMLGEAFPPA